MYFITHLEQGVVFFLSFSRNFSPNFKCAFVSLTSFTRGMKQNLAFLFFTREWGLFLAIGSTVYTSRHYFVPPLFCIFTCLLSVILSLLFLCCPNFFVDTILRYLRAIERSLFALRARLPRFVGIAFSSQMTSPFFRYSSHHISKPLCFPRNILAV